MAGTHNETKVSLFLCDRSRVPPSQIQQRLRDVRSEWQVLACRRGNTFEDRWLSVVGCWFGCRLVGWLMVGSSPVCCPLGRTRRRGCCVILATLFKIPTHLASGDGIVTTAKQFWSGHKLAGHKWTQTSKGKQASTTQTKTWMVIETNTTDIQPDKQTDKRATNEHAGYVHHCL